jgi:hypothetical protein
MNSSKSLFKLLRVFDKLIGLWNVKELSPRGRHSGHQALSSSTGINKSIYAKLHVDKPKTMSRSHRNLERNI